MSRTGQVPELALTEKVLLNRYDFAVVAYNGDVYVKIVSC